MRFAQSVLQAVLAEEGRLFMLLGNEVAAGALFAEAFDIPHTTAKDRHEVYDLFRRTQALFPPNGGNGSGDKAQRSLEKTLAMARKAGSKNLETLIRARLDTEASPARQDDVSIS